MTESAKRRTPKPEVVEPATSHSHHRAMSPADPAEFFMHVWAALAGQMGPHVCADSTIRAITNPDNAKRLYGAYHKMTLEANGLFASGELTND